MRIERAGEILELSGERAIIWPARRALIIADTHFGKDGVFRSLGVAIPAGLSAFDLERVSRLIERHVIERLIVLGDFFHGAPRRSGDFDAHFRSWLERHRELRIDVIAGNHDRHGGHGYCAERIHWHAQDLLEGPFRLGHHPCNQRDENYLLCGHTHPMVILRSSAGDRARVPIFWFQKHCAVLPAFGFFTGGENVRPAPEDGVFAVVAQAGPARTGAVHADIVPLQSLRGNSDEGIAKFADPSSAATLPR